MVCHAMFWMCGRLSVLQRMEPAAVGRMMKTAAVGKMMKAARQELRPVPGSHSDHRGSGTLLPGWLIMKPIKVVRERGVSGRAG
uniref:Uncharacterized protein n=1 Tax=Octopus bimaculoides TaxID=37653 RepID=A0A0L8HT65_OCTBM